MGFFDFLYAKQERNEAVPNIKFGRYSDSYKEKEKYESWDKAIAQYENKEYLASFKSFLDYLKDSKTDNVSYTVTEDIINFEIYQGSKKITGTATIEAVRAEAKIAKTNDLEIGLLRRLVEENFGMKYSRYALGEDDTITMVYYSFMDDGSPFKNYYGIKELSIHADKQDDILVDEFEGLENINTGHISAPSQELIDYKYQYLSNAVQTAIKEVNEGKLNIDQYPGGISYLLLDLVYRCDYLLKPEGFTMKLFEDIHRLYFTKDGKSPQFKNREIIKLLRKIQDREKEEFNDEWYEVKSTFGITAPTNHAHLMDFIDAELGNMDWYRENNHHKVAQAIPNYICGYYLFNYAVPALDKELLHLYFEIVEYAFFNNIDMPTDFVIDNKLQKNKIKNRISSILKKYERTYPAMRPRKDILNFDSILLFSRSYLVFMRNLNLVKSAK